MINKCGVTGELLGPPNYHRYNQMVQQHYAAKVTRMPFEAFRSRIETVRDPEVVNQWLEKMKKVTRYTSKAPVRRGPGGRRLRQPGGGPRPPSRQRAGHASSSRSRTRASTARCSIRCPAARSSWPSRAPTSASCGSRSTPRTSFAAACAASISRSSRRGRRACPTCAR